MEQILIRAPQELKESITNKAKDIGITRNALVLIILNDWLKGDQKSQDEKSEVK